MLQTTYRGKLPKGWSYPIGAERLTEVLSGVPQLDTIELRFHTHEHILASAHQRSLNSGEPITVIRISYRNIQPGLTGSNDMIASGWYAEHWDISVHGVPSGSRSVALRAIVDAGSLLRGWLSSPRPETWRYGRHACAIRIMLPDGEMSFHEE